MKAIDVLTTAAAAILTIGAVLPLASCKKEKTEQLNTVVFDGVEYPILHAAISKEDLEDGNYDITLYLSEDSSSNIGLNACEAKHNGVVIDLTKPESTQGGWVPYIVATIDKKFIFNANLEEGVARLFTTGTLLITRGEGSYFEILLKDGEITESRFGDGKPHKIELHYKGTMDCF